MPSWRGHDEKISWPGALTCGFTCVTPSQIAGPLLENDAIWSLMSVAPTPNDSGKLPGEPTVSRPGPLLPFAKAGKMPAATHARTSSRYSVLYVAVEPHELLTTSGALAGSPPGASIHWKPSWMMLVVVEPESRKILTAIQSASGATPTTSPGGPPTIVPATCVPWPLPSAGVA